MIVQLVQSILDVPDFADEGMGQLAELFRQGQNSNEIMPLLRSNCDEIIFSGAWIAAEINRPLPAALTDRLFELLHHSSPKVRSQALVALNAWEANSSVLATTDAKVLVSKEQQTPGPMRVFESAQLPSFTIKSAANSVTAKQAAMPV